MRPLGFVCAIAVLAGCSSSTFVCPFGGTYDLIDIDGQQTPQPLLPGLTTLEVVGGTLIAGQDTLHVTLSLQSEDSTGRPIGQLDPLVSAIPFVRNPLRAPWGLAVGCR